ncbi:helix-turn-helix domain-containing protein [Candidatus Sumerlaeota bacterium]|nr:helix-turn-helix domain-containing protein [Candidatus Sumerlaeota bacterium]
MINWLTLDEAAEYLKMGRSTLYRLAREGQMPGHKRGRVWRFDAAELDAWMKEGDEKAKRKKASPNDPEDA